MGRKARVRAEDSAIKTPIRLKRPNRGDPSANRRIGDQMKLSFESQSVEANPRAVREDR